MPTKFHIAADGYWMRCQATVRRGQGVSGCPLELEGVEVAHTVGFQGIAAAGGGVIRRADGERGDRFTRVELLEDGGYSSATDKLTRVYDESGKLVPLRERVRAEKLASKEGELPELNEDEQGLVEKDYLTLRSQVEEGLSKWAHESNGAFRAEALTAGDAAERQLYTAETIALLLEIADQGDSPVELAPAMSAVREHLTEDFDAKGYLQQKARERKRDLKVDGAQVSLKDRLSGENMAPVSKTAWRTERLEKLVSEVAGELKLEAREVWDPNSLIERSSYIKTADGIELGVIQLKRSGDAVVRINLRGFKVPSGSEYVDFTIPVSVDPMSVIDRDFEHGESMRGKEKFYLNRSEGVRIPIPVLAQIIAATDMAVREIEDYRATQELLSLADLADPNFKEHGGRDD